MRLFHLGRGIGFSVGPTVVGVLLLAGSALAGSGPVAEDFPVQPVAMVHTVTAGPVDFVQAAAEDLERQEMGLPPRFAVPEPVNITPDSEGTWETLDARRDLWRLRITSPGALSLNLGFSRYRLPKGARLAIYPADVSGPDDPRGIRIFTNRDNETHGELWTPVILGDDIVIELVMPRIDRHDFDLELAAINKGYRFFGEQGGGTGDKSGACNIDVVCPEGDDWRQEIASVGVLSTGGSTYCTGFMINNTAEDERPLFMTADHCGIGVGNAASLVVYWNFQSPECGQHGGGSYNQFMTGSIHLASGSESDFTLVEMDDPVDPDHEIAFAGWNNSTDDLPRAVAIHHPSTDEKSISFEDDPTTTTSYFGSAVPGNGSHIRVEDWDLGTTEDGSSGSPLFDPDHRVVGQLHGGLAACGNDDADWYGRLSVSWPAVSQYLDPLDTGAVTLDTYAPFAATMTVSPEQGVLFEGAVGGPFAPNFFEYVISNNADIPLTFEASANVSWVAVLPSSGFVPEGGTMSFYVTTSLAAADLAQGGYEGELTFLNLTDGQGNTTRPLHLTVGVPELVYAFDMSTDPDWMADNGWAFGQPQGGGGLLHGNPDPFSGHTGSNVYGFNLDGDYPADLPERHLVTGALDCSNLEAVSVRFMRWLNVEQPTYDHASLAVSNDGVNFVSVWENESEITDLAWTPVEYDLSALANGQDSVYLRWTMGITDGTWEFSGWNIDDVEIWGLESTISATDTPTVYRLEVGNHPNPFNPRTTISFELAAEGPVTVKVFDLSGRLVRDLVDEALPAGPQSISWDGMDAAGQRVGSGVYMVRVVSGGQAAEHKMVLLK